MASSHHGAKNKWEAGEEVNFSKGKTISVTIGLKAPANVTKSRQHIVDD
jgi:hypothetical protein